MAFAVIFSPDHLIYQIKSYYLGIIILFVIISISLLILGTYRSYIIKKTTDTFGKIFFGVLCGIGFYYLIEVVLNKLLMPTSILLITSVFLLIGLMNIRLIILLKNKSIDLKKHSFIFSERAMGVVGKTPSIYSKLIYLIFKNQKKNNIQSTVHEIIQNTPFGQIIKNESERIWNGYRPLGDLTPVGRPVSGLESILEIAGLLDSKPKIIVEIGVEYGGSARKLAQLFPETLIIAIDYWKKKYIPDSTPPEWLYLEPFAEKEEGSIINLFLHFCIDIKDRLVPLQMMSTRALPLIARANLVPDIIYIDGDHRYLGVLADLFLCHCLFPSAILVGDDWNFTSSARHYLGHKYPVREAAQEFCNFIGVTPIYEENTYLVNPIGQ